MGYVLVPACSGVVAGDGDLALDRCALEGGTGEGMAGVGGDVARHLALRLVSDGPIERNVGDARLGQTAGDHQQRRRLASACQRLDRDILTCEARVNDLLLLRGGRVLSALVRGCGLGSRSDGG